MLSRFAQVVSLQEQSAAVHKELDLCMVYLHAVQAAAISPDLSQGLPAQGAALQGLPLSLLQTHFSQHNATCTKAVQRE